MEPNAHCETWQEVYTSSMELDACSEEGHELTWWRYMNHVGPEVLVESLWQVSWTAQCAWCSQSVDCASLRSQKKRKLDSNHCGKWTWDGPYCVQQWNALRSAECELYPRRQGIPCNVVTMCSCTGSGVATSRQALYLLPQAQFSTSIPLHSVKPKQSNQNKPTYKCASSNNDHWWVRVHTSTAWADQTTHWVTLGSMPHTSANRHYHLANVTSLQSNLVKAQSVLL